MRRFKGRKRDIRLKDWSIIAIILLPWSILWDKIIRTIPYRSIKVIVSIVMFLVAVIFCTKFLGNILRYRECRKNALK